MAAHAASLAETGADLQRSARLIIWAVREPLLRREVSAE